jgi:uncharacterized NAD(P)/FAD-binding protein YdhS
MIWETALQDRRTHVLIIGGGASGVLLACHLLRNPESDLHVTLIEKRPEVGRGVAYCTTNPDHLLNVRAANMSAFPDQPDHFWRWLGAHDEDRGSGTWQSSGGPFCFAPRKVYCEYLTGLIAPLRPGGRRSGRLRVIRGECVSLAQLPSGVAITLADGSLHQGDFAVLATGHEASAGHTGQYIDPWTMPAHAGVEPDSRMLLLGTGLTMVDYVLSLGRAGHKGPIFGMSRRGLLPRAHRDVEPLPIERVDVPFGKTTPHLLRWLRNRIEEHARQGGDWRGVLDGIRPFVQQIWQGLPMPARRSFLEHARAWWEVHRHRMAPEVERRIDAALESGRLQVMAAKLCGIEQGTEDFLIRYRRRGATTVETMHVDKIVECRQIGPAPLKVVNPALRSLIEGGLARLDPLQLGIDVTPESAVISRSGATSERIFAVGPVTRPAFWEIIAIPDICEQCVALANRLCRSLPTAARQRLTVHTKESEPI